MKKTEQKEVGQQLFDALDRIVEDKVQDLVTQETFDDYKSSIEERLDVIENPEEDEEDVTEEEEVEELSADEVKDALQDALDNSEDFEGFKTKLSRLLAKMA